MSVFEWIVIGSLPIFLLVLLTIENALIKVGNRLVKQAEQQTEYLSHFKNETHDLSWRMEKRTYKELLGRIEDHLSDINKNNLRN